MLSSNQLLKRARKNSKITQIEIAKRMDVYQSYYNRLETGKIDLTYTMMKKFCDAIDITLEDLFREDSLMSQYVLKMKDLSKKDCLEIFQIIDSKISKK